MEKKPLIIQSDASLMLDTHSALFAEARNNISLFAELEKSPEHFHLYRISNLSVWNAAASGVTIDQIEYTLNLYSRYDPPSNVIMQLKESYKRYGKLQIEQADNGLALLLVAPHASDYLLMHELINQKKIKRFFIPLSPGVCQLVDPLSRGTIKQELIKMGWPVKDLAPLKEGSPLSISMRSDVTIRDYQVQSVDAFIGDNKPGSGFGVIVLPCGSGKTIVGMAIMATIKNETLILAANIAAGRQWIRELIAKTDIDPSMIGEYSGARKEIRAITVATYQILVWRADRESEFEHFKLFGQRQWGLIIYDEAHLLPAPVFRVTAEIQSVRRLGLTATLVREDGAETDVFSLIGPKRFDAPWRELERKGWIAEAFCIEVKVDLTEADQYRYAVAERRVKISLAAQNNQKTAVALALARRHEGQSILIIGQYINQLETLAKAFNAPIITGKTSNGDREIIYNSFRAGEIKILVVSKVANFSIDLPDASIAIQVSGTFGSRQEEAQRLGRILRPKKCSSYFYSLVSRFTDEELFSANRQKFLAEQGYAYSIETEGDILS